MLEDTIADIVGKLREGAYPNEQSVSQGIVLRVLSELHWDVFEPSVVWPEYATAGGGRADFALCEPRSKPKVLIEVKQPGKAAGGVRQSLEYAFHTGVPFVVLTDGRTWSFYLPAEAGDYEDRRVFKLDLYEHSAERAAGVLERYVHWQAVASGKALDDARSEHRNKANKALARQAIPDAWRWLVEQCDEVLLGLVSDVVESKEGIRPDFVDVERFLASLSTQAPSDSFDRLTTSLDGRQKKVVRASTAKAKPVSLVDRSSILGQGGVAVVRGEEFSYANAKEAMLVVLRELAAEDSNFLSRCYLDPSFRGRTRRYISRNVGELYPNRTDLQQDYVEPLPDGWWVGTHLNYRQKEGLVRAAIEVAGLTLGSDVVFTQ